MIKLFLMLFFPLWLSASPLSKLYNFYEKQEYDKGCDYGHKYYTKNSKSEKYATLYALSCLETNNIDRVARSMLSLNSSKESRENASYFTTILLQKELLMQAILDDKPLGDLVLPKTSFYLSKVFDGFVAKRYTKDGEAYYLKDSDNPERYYKIYIETTKNKEHYMIIDIYEKEKFTKRYRYK